MTGSSEAVLTVREASEYLRLAESTVYRLLLEGKVPGRKVGGKWRISRAGLEEWLREAPGQPDHEIQSAL